MITQEFLKERVTYSHKTGLFKWKKSKYSRAVEGEVAGRPTTAGHVQLSIEGKRYAAHRLVYLYVYGKMPNKTLVVDHINGNKQDNRLSNLRVVSHAQNLQNSKRSKANSSGYKGVTFEKNIGKWRAYITKNYKTTKLGFFDTKEEAYQARLAKEEEYKWLSGCETL